MAGYERKVEYLYEFDDGFRKNNAGFARIEGMEDQYRVTVHITVSNLGESLDKVFFYYRTKEGIKKFLLGEFRTRNGSGNFRIHVKKEQLTKEGFDSSKIEGILVYLSERRYFIAGESPLNFTENQREQKTQEQKVVMQEKTLQEELQQADVLQEEIVQEEPQQAYVLQEEPQQAYVLQEEILQEEILQEDIMQAKYESTKEDTSIEIPEFSRQNPDLWNTLSKSLAQEEEAKEQATVYEETMEEEPLEAQKESQQEVLRALRAFQYCTPMFPFEDNELQECVKLELPDLGLLPMEQWPLVHNSFLLHSFYLYGHILLAKKQGRSGWQYFLMVPGVFQNKERSIASRFGFRDFKCARKREQRQGEFGYWYLPIAFV